MIKIYYNLIFNKSVKASLAPETLIDISGMQNRGRMLVIKVLFPVPIIILVIGNQCGALDQIINMVLFR